MIVMATYDKLTSVNFLSFLSAYSGNFYLSTCFEYVCGNVKVCPSFSVSNHSDLINTYKNKLQGKMLRTLDNHTYTAPSCSSIDLQSQTKIDPKSKIISLSPRRYDLALEVTGSSVIDPHKLNGTCLLVPLHNLVMMIR